MTAYKQNADKRLVTQSLAQNVKNWNNRECSQVRMVDTISQPGCAECGASGLVLTDYRPYAFLRALLKDSLRNLHIRLHFCMSKIGTIGRFITEPSH